ncbi:ribonuclease P protein component [Treponema paraluiscuniculi Cuniculi A]|uniref:Ribonuclease P protein component n=2 Tax=Treponema paraluiscuniculi TaxID=53435 RepID=F7XR32_TREPU|nr:ribonuclease P protein component [Treponema paraluiscuniculi]AEH40874.1 ribonuclease P protein component [Treponema paraluiscuniculi Cuniculi A]WKC72803.1 ribonuclease P protein component [Treponema paraluiscuniculi]
MAASRVSSRCSTVRVTFDACERLRGSCRVRAVFKQGRRFCYGRACLFVLPNGCTCSRFLATFRRGYGKAVARNRARRLSKEAYRALKSSLVPGFDLVLLVSVVEDSLAAYQRLLCVLCDRARLFSEFTAERQE